MGSADIPCLQCRRLTVVSNASNSDPALNPSNKSPFTSPRLGAEDRHTSLDSLADIYKVKDALEACRSLKRSAEPRHRSPTKPAIVENRNGYVADIEEDFTTRAGQPGTLGCPFANMGAMKVTATDPIAAEINSARSLGPGSAYAQEHPFRCPIRYLNQHSPEEVTKYFEKHKHELPRSHSICVSRYRQDGSKVRQLDAKYGNLQNMIQSLGATHQQYLSAKDGEENVPVESSPPAPPSVGDWAKNIDAKSPKENTAPEPRERVEVDESLQTPPEYGDSLREVRLGESPSRPWGISVPAQEVAASAISERDIEPLSLQGERSERASDKQDQGSAIKQCPFGHDAEPRCASQKDGRAGPDPENGSPKGVPQRPMMVFNGPVFFGYSPEQVATLIKSGALGPPQP